jgi:hypothetical protein
VGPVVSRYRAKFQDPDATRHPVPTYGWRAAPDHLVTRRQLRAEGLCPGGREPVARLMWAAGRTTRFANLYDRTRARPKRVPSPAQLAALGKALIARQTCPECTQVREYCIPTSLGMCVDCAGY